MGTGCRADLSRDRQFCKRLLKLGSGSGPNQGSAFVADDVCRVAAHDGCHQPGIHFLPSDEDDIGRLAHRVGGLDHANQAACLDQAEGVADLALVFFSHVITINRRDR